jgi:mono/diheme cytochrome c family protein
VSASRPARDAIAIAAAVWLVLAASAAPADERVAAGRKLFKNEGCPQCHGFGGEGDGYLLGMLKEPVKMRDWTNAEAMRTFDDAYLFEITKRGGEALGKNKVMLKYAHKLDDQQIRTIVVFIRSLAAAAAATPAPAP